MRNFLYESLEGMERQRQPPPTQPGPEQPEQPEAPPVMAPAPKRRLSRSRLSSNSDPAEVQLFGKRVPLPPQQVLLLGAVLGAVVLLVAAVFVLPGTSGSGVKVRRPGGQAPGGTGNLQGRCTSELQPKESLCTGCPPMFDGKLCASTTRYNDMTKGACGCGDQDPVPADFWTLTQFTAALNCKNLDPAQPMLSWCPAGCGACFELCSTGGTTSGKAGTTKAGVCRVFTVTNRCGDGYKEYPEWCSNELTYEECARNPARCRERGSTNKYGYSAHFDLQDYHLQVSSASAGLGWDNAEVTFEPVACSRWSGPLRQCTGCTMVEKPDWQDARNATII
mmetsp:Transcript_80687/g.248857  ORF Transcript_80687/g.248857 Transcript_80687/m.248857 type:complete len:336 (+) Transcript_80687:32-1039(+)